MRIAYTRVRSARIIVTVALVVAFSIFLANWLLRTHQFCGAIRMVESIGGKAFVVVDYGPEWFQRLFLDNGPSGYQGPCRGYQRLFGRMLGIYAKGASVTDSLVTRVLQFQPSHVHLIDSAITSKSVASIGQLRNLQVLQLSGARIGDADLRRLRGLDQLEVLRLDRTEISDHGLVHCGGLAKLCYLDLSSTCVSDAGLHALRGNTNLKILHLANTRLTDFGVRELSKQRQITGLDLAFTRVSDVGIGHMVRMKQLERLNLDGTVISDRGLRVLKDMDSLRYLSLNKTQITDVGALTLANMYQLWGLSLRDTGVSQSSIEYLSHALYACVITCPDGSKIMSDGSEVNWENE